MTAQAWLVRPYPNKVDQLDQFKAKGIVAIGWRGIGDLSGKGIEDIKKTLSGEPYNYASLKLGNVCAPVDIIVNRMRPGDLVLVPHGDDIAFAEVTSDYQFDPAIDADEDGYPHQRRVKWLSSTSRSSLSKGLRSSLKVQRTAANLSKHFDEIAALSKGEEYAPSAKPEEAIRLSYPLRPDFKVEFSIPADITKDEADRLSTYFSTLYFSQE